MNSLNFHSQEAAQQRFKSVAFFVTRVVCMESMTFQQKCHMSHCHIYVTFSFITLYCTVPLALHPLSGTPTHSANADDYYELVSLVF
jgi:hypothetical protein